MKLKNITLVFENCDSITIDGKYVGEFIVDDIHISIERIACNAIERIDTKAREESLTSEEYEFLEYFEMTFAKSMMKELWSSDKIAKIILAHKDMLGDIKIKVQ